MRLNVVYLEELASLRSMYLLPLLAEEVNLYLVTCQAKYIPPAPYADVSLLPPPAFNLHRSWALARAANQFLRRRRMDVIHTSMAADWLLRTDVPVVTHCGDLWYHDWRVAARQRPVWRRAEVIPGFLHYVVPQWVSLKRAKRIITVSHSLREQVINLLKIEPGKVVTIYNAPAGRLFRAFAGKSEADPPHVVFAGRLHEGKGIGELVERFVGERHLDVPVTIIGDGPQRGLIERLAREDRRVSLTGHQPREVVYRYLARTNIFVCPSLYEGLSNSLLEAMAAGHACVVRNVPALVEAIGYENGFVCADVDEMIAAIRLLASDRTLRFELQQRAARRARQFSWKRGARQILDVYRSVRSA